jgi:gamma-glutamyl:cysteine ligase YbdK (ATP-grasp superfamily)
VRARRAVAELTVLARHAHRVGSCRHFIFSAFPRSGPPPRFESYEQFAAIVGELVACGCIEDYTRIW